MQLANLSQRQQQLIRRAASTLPPIHRDGFMSGVLAHLGDRPTDLAVSVVINSQLDVVLAQELATAK